LVIERSKPFSPQLFTSRSNHIPDDPIPQSRYVVGGIFLRDQREIGYAISSVESEIEAVAAKPGLSLVPIETIVCKANYAEADAKGFADFLGIRRFHRTKVPERVCRPKPVEVQSLCRLKI
jgi:hypothetical protein